jgi:hypothetical protein
MRTNSLLTKILLALVCLSPTVQAHPVHQSTAEVEFDPKSKKLEISLTVDVNDLELALTRQCDRAISMDKTPPDEFNAQTKIYLDKNFQVTDAAGNLAKIEWKGRELVAESVKSADPSVRLFFQVPLPGGVASAKLRHAVFCALFKDQINLVHLRHNQTNRELRFSRDDAAKMLIATESVR